MKNILLIIIAFHGLIHLLGFFKAFNLIEIKELTKPIAPITGVLWLITTLLLITVVLTFGLNFEYWWIVGIVASLLSQRLIINSWSDAKFGTLVNILIIVLVFYELL